MDYNLPALNAVIIFLLDIVFAMPVSIRTCTGKRKFSYETWFSIRFFFILCVLHLFWVKSYDVWRFWIIQYTQYFSCVAWGHYCNFAHNSVLIILHNRGNANPIIVQSSSCKLVICLKSQVPNTRIINQVKGHSFDKKFSNLLSSFYVAHFRSWSLCVDPYQNFAHSVNYQLQFH